MHSSTGSSNHVKMASERCKQVKTVITKEQDEIFRRYKNEGLTSVAAQHKEKIAEVVRATGLPLTVVRSRITNMNRTKDTHKKQERQSGGLNPYQMFCQETTSTSGDSVTRLQDYSKMYADLSKEEKDEYYRRSKENKKRKASELTEQERDYRVKKHTKTIQSTFAKLEELNTDGLCVIKKGSSTFACSSGQGETVLDNNISKLQTDFFVATAKKGGKAAENRQKLRTQFITKLNSLYSSYIGRAAEFPYTQYKDGTASFIMEGLPPGIRCRESSLATMDELHGVLDGKLVLVPKDSQSPLTKDNRRVERSPPHTEVADILAAPRQELAMIDTNLSQDGPSLEVTQTEPGSAENMLGTETDVDLNLAPILGEDGAILGSILQEVRSSQDTTLVAMDVIPAAEAIEKLKLGLSSKKKNKSSGKENSKSSKKITAFFSSDN